MASRRALDTIRRERARDLKQTAAHLDWTDGELDELDRRAERWHSGIEDDRLRLIFTCCHPVLDLSARVALTLRSVGGLTTDEIAAAFGVPSPTMGQRISRAKARLSDAGIGYRVPEGAELPDRLAAVLRVVYLVFNEAYLSRRPAEPLRVDLAEEAIRLGRSLHELMPDEPEVTGLLALLLALHARSPARFDDRGDLVLLDDQDRRLWNHELVTEADSLLESALRRRTPGPYQLQAAIAALHSQAPTFGATDWSEIAALYDLLAGIDPSPVVSMNRAVAVGFSVGPQAGLTALDAIDPDRLPGVHLWHAARGEMLLRAGDRPGAATAFRAALAAPSAPAEQRHLRQRLAACES